MTKLYPLKFRTIFKDKLWGGEKIKTILGKDFSPLPNCGETWEISGVEGNISEVAEGPLAGNNLKSLIEQYQANLVGESVYEKYGDEFPLLVKFIDANADLSIQVHPDDELAKKRHNSFGKTEMWYIFQADPGASLISGFNQPTDKEKYLHHLENKTLNKILNYERVTAGDVFFMPAGRVHSIGKGCLLAEIQQTSDVTYRIYDFDRKDAAGNTRELHTAEALDAIDYQYYQQYKSLYHPQPDQPVQLATCPYFETSLLQLGQSMERDYHKLDSFVIYVCFEGGGHLLYEGGKVTFQQGDALLLPASLKKVDLQPDKECSLLETYIPGVG